MTLQELKMKKETLEMQVKSIKQEIADTEKQIQIEELKPKRWKPEFEEIYYYINSRGEVRATRWNDADFDNYKYATGNCFKTVEEAEFALEQLKVLVELKEYADDMEWDGDNKHCLMYYNKIDDCVDILFNYNDKYVPFDIYFSSEEQARKAVEAIGEERLKKYYFCV